MLKFNNSFLDRAMLRKKNEEVCIKLTFKIIKVKQIFKIFLNYF